MPRTLVCRGCLAVQLQSVPTHDFDAAQAYERLIGVPLMAVCEIAAHLCSYCSRMLHRFTKFKERCLRVMEVLRRAQVQGRLETDEYTKSLSSSYPELKLQYVQTKTLVIEFDSSPVKTFKHEIHGDVNNIEVPNIFNKKVRLDNSGMNTETLEEDFLNHDLLDVKSENSDVELAVKPYEVYIKDNNALDNKKVHSFKKKNCKQTIRMVKSKKKKLNKSAKSDMQIVTDYAKSAGFDIAFLSHEEQIREVEEKKKESISNGVSCQQCGKVFRDPQVLERHEKNYHVLKPNSFMCDICSCVFHNKRALRAHVTGHSWVFTCQSCNFTTKQRPVLRKHQYYHRGKMFSCKYCEKAFDKHATYYSHVRLLHAAQLPSCDLCGEFYNSVKGVETHKKLSHNVAEEFPNACGSCDKRFKSDAALERHSSVGGCNARSCAQCGDSFTSDDFLKYHLVQRHCAETSPETFDCDMCRRRFYNRPALDRHVCDAKASCVQCGDNFDAAQSLNEHFASAHHIFKCEECGKQFTNAMYFRRHHSGGHTGRARGPAATQSHTTPGQTKVRKYPARRAVRQWSATGVGAQSETAIECDKDGDRLVCELCGRRVRSLSALKLHQQTRHSSRRFSCDTCRKGFTRKDLLLCHLRVHSGERPFSCARCPKAFKTSPAWRRHQLVHTGERAHVCSLCGAAFQLSTAVKLHIRTKHLRMPWPKRNRARNRQHEQTVIKHS